MSDDTLLNSRMRLRDIVSVGSIGLRSRRTRTALTATGIAIGIAALISIFGITEAGNAAAQAEIDALGADLLLVAPGTSVTGEATLPAGSGAVLDAAIPGIEIVSSVYAVEDGKARRNSFIPEAQTGGLAVIAVGPTDVDLLAPINATVAQGRFHDQTTVEVPTAVIGSLAARRLGITDLTRQPVIDITGHSFQVIGILDELKEFNADFNRNVIIGLPVAQQLFDAGDNPTAIYLQVPPEQIEQIRNVVPDQADPENPNEVAVSRPTEALQARAIIEDTFRQLLVAVAGITGLVGAIGVANVMVISALERRGEIGLRRSLGATKGHIALQFLVESMLLSTLGGVIGSIIGLIVTVAWSRLQGWSVLLPWDVVFFGIAGAAVVGAVAGLYPAWRASQMDPAEAVRPAG
jgi:putative ABC transport system permease protein